MLELLDVVVDVTRDGPDQLESIEERLHRLSDGLEVAVRDDLELAVQGVQEFDEVLGLSLLLHEALLLLVVLLDHVGVLVLRVAQELVDLLHGGHLELLVQRVERGGAVRPEFGLALSCEIASLSVLLLLLFEGLRNFLGPVLL